MGTAPPHLLWFMGSRESGEKAGLREGEEMPVFCGETGSWERAQQDVELRSEAGATRGAGEYSSGDLPAFS